MEFNIPKGYKGVKQDIRLLVNNHLAVITGLNGCGKTTILKHIYETYKDKSKIFFKTSYDFNSDAVYSRAKRLANFRRGDIYDRYIKDEPVSLDDVIDEIINQFRRQYGRKYHYLEDYEVFQMLFDEHSILYSEGEVFLEEVAGIISNHTGVELDSVRQKLGVPTEKQIGDSTISKINQRKRNGDALFEGKHGRVHYQDYINCLARRGIGQNRETFQTIKELQDESKTDLKLTNRQKSKITSKEKLEEYIHELIMSFSLSIDSIVKKMERRIYEDHKSKSTQAKKLWQEINDEIKKFKHFPYEIVEPSILTSNYQISFRAEGSSVPIRHISLSSGEKAIFELICYSVYIQNNKKTLEVMILDEFDANLNPALASTYLSVIREQFCNKNITVILTTHSPSTVVEVEPQELFELSIGGCQTIQCAENDEGKKRILKQLAPNFVYKNEFGSLQYVVADNQKPIVLVEGKYDQEYLSSSLDEFTFIACNSADNIKNVIAAFRAVPVFKEAISKKVLICLYDFDQKGVGCAKKLCSNSKDQELSVRIDKCELPYVKIENKDFAFYVATYLPAGNSWCFVNNPYRHQELNDEGEEGLTRQKALLDAIINQHTTVA